MIIALYIAAGLILAAGSLYFAWRNRDFLKFLRILRLMGHFILSLPCRCFGAFAGNRDCRTTQDQRHPLHCAFHPLPSSGSDELETNAATGD